MYILCAGRGMSGSMSFAPLYILRFRFIVPSQYLLAQQFLRKNSSYASLTNVPDRLRWCRNRLGLLQKDVAARIGVSRNVYVAMETGNTQYCSAAIADKLAELYQIPVSDLLDDYNLFLYRGPAEQIKKHRSKLGLSPKEYAKYLGVSESSVRHWERGCKQVKKETWANYLKGIV